MSNPEITKVTGIAMMHDETDRYPMFIAGDEQPEETDLEILPATLIIAPPGSTVPPEVMEVAKVKAMLEEMDASHHVILGSMAREEFHTIAAKHGITLP